MPSPFPGMDPFIEGQRWEDFHTRLIPSLSDALVPLVRPRYVVQVEILPLPLPERRREPYLTLRDRESRAVVTVIEVLSPSNKRRGGDGRREYLRKREEVLGSAAHLVELDLLRGGDRLPTVEPLPLADYYAFVSREQRRPRVEVYHWTFRNSLPTVFVPLAGGDPDVPLDLQAIITDLYNRAGYDYSLNYQGAIEPTLDVADAVWIQELLAPRPTEGSRTEPQ
jgi:uncharacterized protein DUF4058